MQELLDVWCKDLWEMASASVPRPKKPRQASQHSGEHARRDVVLKQAAAHAHKQPAAHRLTLPTQDLKRGTISNPVV